MLIQLSYLHSRVHGLGFWINLGGKRLKIVLPHFFT
nr:MAG TPA: hypothetical protein [Caudoviricetes sp.]